MPRRKPKIREGGTTKQLILAQLDILRRSLGKLFQERRQRVHPRAKDYIDEGDRGQVSTFNKIS